MKRMRILILVAALVLALPATALGLHKDGESNSIVIFTQNEDWKYENFTPDKDGEAPDDWADQISQLQPGDDVTFTVELHHEHSTPCDWYMSNKVIDSLEAKYAAGSAYAYELTYEGPDKDSQTQTLYSSTAVGGERDGTKGLKDATDKNALDEYFYLDTLKKGDIAKVKVNVALDGETEGNAYFEKDAGLNMRFAVEMSDKKNNSSTSSTHRGTVQTGDDTNLFPFFLAMAVSGALLLILGIYGVRQRKQEREEAVR